MKTVTRVVVPANKAVVFQKENESARMVAWPYDVTGANVCVFYVYQSVVHTI